MDGALYAFRRAVDGDPLNARSWVKQGSVLSDMDCRTPAAECFRAAEALDANDSNLYLHRGQLHVLANEHSAAVKDLRRSTELCPSVAGAWAAWGVALFKRASSSPGQVSPMSESLKVMEDALRQFPESPEVLLFFSEILTQLGDFSRALGLLRRAAAAEPQSPLPFVNAARAYLGMNDLISARR
ncbi:unnamed protein product [Choristocarpus tenellus]